MNKHITQGEVMRALSAIGMRIRYIRPGKLRLQEKAA